MSIKVLSSNAGKAEKIYNRLYEAYRSNHLESKFLDRCKIGRFIPVISSAGFYFSDSRVVHSPNNITIFRNKSISQINLERYGCFVRNKDVYYNSEYVKETAVTFDTVYSSSRTITDLDYKSISIEYSAVTDQQGYKTYKYPIYCIDVFKVDDATNFDSLVRSLLYDNYKSEYRESVFPFSDESTDGVEYTLNTVAEMLRGGFMTTARSREVMKFFSGEEGLIRFKKVFSVIKPMVLTTTALIDFIEDEWPDWTFFDDDSLCDVLVSCQGFNKNLDWRSFLLLENYAAKKIRDISVGGIEDPGEEYS